jgi:RNA polymerase sigma factor (sigma-70 family)
MKAFKKEKNRMDNAKIKNFVSENMKTIFAYALNRLSSHTDAEELTSEIILALLSSGDKLKDENAIYGFVWAIANNTYKKFLSKRKKNIYVELDETMADENEGIVDLVMLEEEVLTLRRELTLLSKEHRICTVAYYFQHMGCKKIAETYHFSLEMVKYYLFKSRKILKEGIDMERQYCNKNIFNRPIDK